MTFSTTASRAYRPAPPIKTGLLIGLLFLAAGIGFPCLCFAADLKVSLSGADSRGEIRAALFKNQKGFDTDSPVEQKSVPSASSLEITFTGLAPGRYGVAAYQDLNQNKKLDTNFFGLPTEPYGFSQNAQGKMGPPSFEDFSIEVPESGAQTQIEID